MLEPYLGEISICAFAFAPKGWAFCHGQLLPINQYQALFSLLGTTYGGNGQTTFALPDLRGRSPLHFSPNRPLGSRLGEEAHTLLTSELPGHAHTFMGSTDLANTTTPTGALPAAKARGGKDIYTTGGPLQTLHPQAVAPTGGGQPHENMQPFLTLNFVIALQGVFPSRN